MDINNFNSLTGSAREMALEKIAIPSRLALFHTMFNLTNICVLIGFVPQIEKIACWVLKGGAGYKHRTALQRIEYLTSNVSEMGELALFEGQKELVKLSQLSGEMFNGFVYVIQNPDKDLSADVARLRDLEQESDKLSVALTNFFCKMLVARIESKQHKGRYAKYDNSARTGGNVRLLLPPYHARPQALPQTVFRPNASIAGIYRILYRDAEVCPVRRQKSGFAGDFRRRLG